MNHHYTLEMEINGELAGDNNSEEEDRDEFDAREEREENKLRKSEEQLSKMGSGWIIITWILHQIIMYPNRPPFTQSLPLQLDAQTE